MYHLKILEKMGFVEKVRGAYRRMVEEEYEEEYARAVVTYLALILSRCSDFDSTLVRCLIMSKMLVILLQDRHYR